jgi:hypothetical protein
MRDVCLGGGSQSLRQRLGGVEGVIVDGSPVRNSKRLEFVVASEEALQDAPEAFVDSVEYIEYC